MRVLVSIEDFASGCSIADFLACWNWTRPLVFKLLHVIELPFISSDSPESDIINDKLLQELRHSSYELLSKIRARLLTERPDHVRPRSGPTSSIEIEMEILFGHPHHSILAAANEWNADLIVLGSHRKGSSLGSVSSSVASRARCSVTVVPTDSEADSGSVGASRRSSVLTHG